VVAAHVLLNTALTAGAKAHSILIVGEPGTKLFPHCVVAADFLPVPQFFALKADLCGALRAYQLLGLVVRRSHMCLAASFWAPANERVSLQLLFVSEALIFAKQGVVFAKDLTHNIHVYRALALMVETLDFINLSSFDVFLQRGNRALLAESVPAYEHDGAAICGLSCSRNRVAIADLTVFFFDNLDFVLFDNGRFLLLEDLLSCVLNLLLNLGRLLQAVLSQEIPWLLSELSLRVAPGSQKLLIFTDRTCPRLLS